MSAQESGESTQETLTRHISFSEITVSQKQLRLTIHDAGWHDSAELHSVPWRADLCECPAAAPHRPAMLSVADINPRCRYRRGRLAEKGRTLLLSELEQWLRRRWQSGSSD